MLTLITSLVLVILLESVRPLRSVGADAPWRWLNNLLLTALSTATTLLAPLLFWAIPGLLAFERGGAVGLLPRTDAPAWLAWAVTFLVLDSLGYALHRISHAVPWLWRLHAVHHSDTEMDATTTHRHHPLENLFTSLVSIPVLLLLGAPPLAVLLYAVVAHVVTTFAHANLSFDPALERVLGGLLVTPDFHRNHHRSERRWTDSNYGIVLPWFDRLLGTATGVDPPARQREVELGLEHFRTSTEQRLDRLLLMPFARRGFGAPASA